jgi:hypothetical protein
VESRADWPQRASDSRHNGGFLISTVNPHYRSGHASQPITRARFLPITIPLVSADKKGVTAEDLVDRELMFSRFRRLIGELTRGTLARTTFQPWEVTILIDIETCEIDPKRRIETLRQYERAVQQQLETGPGPPLLLSEYLQRRMTRRPSMV